MFGILLTFFFSSSDSILYEITKTLPNLKLIRLGLSDDLVVETLLKIIEAFKLNEDILSSALPILCKKVCQPVDERVENLLTFYSSAEKNENIRFILLSGLAELKKELFYDIPYCVLNLLLDDEEEIRNEICKILSFEAQLNPAASLRKFIHSIGPLEFAKFLDNYETTYHLEPREPLKVALFEKEPLNLFIDIQYLRKKFLPQ